ncbi:uncharacterized protein LOC131655866 [Vicia villosa]|uniref:uncharacterized protein LOC131655866 n=1 Tax=Vicia villosa TaxID=3911 RepID=UPI00273B2765|nr:uncharacterized protein LOC131655866 [Vicia villosa]
MSKELDTNLLGVISQPSESCDERGKRPKLEGESEPESDSESEPEFLDWDHTEKPYEDLVYDDFAKRFDDYPRPYYFGCSRFIYKNKARIKQEEEEEKAMADYLHLSANLSPFDAIPVPPLANRCGNNFPKPMIIDDDVRDLLIELSKFSLEKYNGDQGSKYVFHDLVKACRCRIPHITYFITFEAKDAATHVDPLDSPITTFQAHVWKRFTEDGPPVVKSCSIKT